MDSMTDAQGLIEELKRERAAKLAAATNGKAASGVELLQRLATQEKPKRDVARPKLEIATPKGSPDDYSTTPLERTIAALGKLCSLRFWRTGR